MELIHLAIIEDDPVVRESLESFLGIHPSIQLKHISTSVEDFIKKIKTTRHPKVDILILDIGLPGMSGLEGIRPIKKILPDTDIVMLTTYEEDDKIFKALCAGAVSYLTKRTSLAKIQEAIFTIHRGGSSMSPSIARKVVEYFSPKEKKEAQLTARQKQIVKGIVDGLSYKMIADKYMISLDTVRDHIKKIYKTLEIHSKGELIRKSMDGEI
ncbi:MAG TPA: response regulator transcription factor [Phaeodactylibacter sp.]|nr:response regulator transcription factor [Phaeodactylibacter sp.]